MTAEDAGLAPFERVARQMTEDIRAGKFQPGEKLPAQRELKVIYGGVAIGTLQRAIQLLQDRGVLITRPPVGTYVAANPLESSEPMTLEQLALTVDDLRERVARLENQ